MSVKKLHSTAIIQLLTGSAKFSEVSKTVFAMPIGVIIVVCFLQKKSHGSTYVRALFAYTFYCHVFYYFFQNHLFFKNILECQTYWSQIITGILSVLICVKIVSEGY